ncbi:hypothetical protein ASE17_05480 [Phenylobacterium sp. Root77]|jgi:hypothetical protein|uniref:hypothetical protein n=1 Tax=unclassified Phenylobacterium TaxID=2640670 RepID=UPI0006FDD6A0|nr:MULTISPECIES: hypothetical protein [unclassified Phenylobacterium]KQW66489.1 hypothetical protein ASC73_19145 [Phenylobacterium sp. Root1277]KQW88995.1 hypothetical protein ASC79_20050 [Phenylobacterium sp. Root1290]KRC42149.1 hypothetical protein ASE17_05480 [Phenylobacterium sp. Root77]
MTDIKITAPGDDAQSFLRALDGGPRMDPDTRQLLQMAAQLGPRDRVALSHIIRRAGEICDEQGEEVALAVLQQIEAILNGRKADA